MNEPSKRMTYWRIVALWRTLLNNGEVIVEISHLLLHNITSQGNDNASQNKSKWKFQWRKRRTVLFSQNKSYDQPEWR